MSRSRGDDPITEGPATIGLLLNVAAVISFAIALAAFGSGEHAAATAIGCAAVLAFAASLAFFVVDAHRTEESAEAIEP